MPPIDPKNKDRFESANGNGNGAGPGHGAPPRDASATSVAQPLGPKPAETEGGMGPQVPRDVSRTPTDAEAPPGADEAQGASPRPSPTAETPPPGGGRNTAETFQPDQPPGPADLMPRRRSARSREGSPRPRKGRAAKDPATPARPHVARGAAREERRQGPAALARQGGRARSLPARREGADRRRGGYVMGTANPCRSCNLAVWLAGKDHQGRWVKVNLDGSPHICGLPMTGLGRIPMPLALPPGPQPPSAPAAPHAAAAPLWPAAQAVVDQGRLWVERFMVGVALVALLFLATIPRDIRGAPSGSRDAAPQAAAQAVGIAPASASAARPSPPRKDAFSLGSTEDDVMAVMGPPREIQENRWWYGSSYVDFRNSRVVNFYNSIHGELKVRIQAALPTSRPTYLAKGLTKDEVLNLQGTPTRLAGNRWYYGSSYVDFQEEHVSDYFNGILRELRLPARPSAQ